VSILTLKYTHYGRKATIIFKTAKKFTPRRYSNEIWESRPRGLVYFLKLPWRGNKIPKLIQYYLIVFK
jgi:hypothetical protein